MNIDKDMMVAKIMYWGFRFILAMRGLDAEILILKMLSIFVCVSQRTFVLFHLLYLLAYPMENPIHGKVDKTDVGIPISILENIVGP